MGRYVLEISSTAKEFDPVSPSLLSQIKEDLRINSIENVEFSEIFELELNESKEKIESAIKAAFIDPITQTFSIDKPTQKQNGVLVKVSFLPGITDNVGIIARRAIEDCFSRKLSPEEKVKYVKKYYFTGHPTSEEIHAICTGLLANKQVEEFVVEK